MPPLLPLEKRGYYVTSFTKDKYDITEWGPSLIITLIVSFGELVSLYTRCECAPPLR